MMKLVPLATNEVPQPSPAPYQAGTTLMMPTGEVITAYNNSLMLTLPTGGHHDLGIALDHRDNPTFLPVDGGRRLLLTTLWDVWDIDFAKARATRLLRSSLPLKSALPAPGGAIVTMREAPYRELTYWQPASNGTLKERWEVTMPDGTEGISACGDLPAVLVHGDTYADTAWLVAFDTKGPRPVALLLANVATVMWDTDTRRLLLLPLDEDGEPTDTWHHLESAEKAVRDALGTDPATGPDDFKGPRLSFDGDGDDTNDSEDAGPNGRSDEARAVRYTTFYDRANGPSLDRCVFPAWRYDDAKGIVAGQSETWLMASGLTNGSLDVHGHMPSTYHYVAAWMTDDGDVFVADRLNSSVYFCPGFDAAKGGTWQHHEVPMSPLGLCGTPDGGMFVWGSVHSACLLYAWNGQSFELMQAPGFAIHAMHGRASNALWAAGALGMVAYWNGETWHAFKTETNEYLNSIFMCEDGRAYATGSWGSLVRGGIDDGHFEPWMTMIDGPSAGTRFHGVVHWQGAVWLAADEKGLIRLADGDEKLQLFGPECHAIGVHARERLIVSCPNQLIDTADGRKWRTAFEGVLLAKASAPRPTPATEPAAEAAPAPEPTATKPPVTPNTARPTAAAPASPEKSAAPQAIDDDTYYIGATGSSIFNCIFRGFRFLRERGYDPREGEAWIMMLDNDAGRVRTSAHLPKHARMSGVVRLSDGRVIAANQTHRCIHETPSLDAIEGGQWKGMRLPIAPNGLLALPDDTLITWGPSEVGESVLRRIGESWDSFYALDFTIRCIHGVTVDALWAAGDDGRAVFWDGDRWHERPIPLDHAITAIHVRADGIVFAGTDHGVILMHDREGWHIAASLPGPNAEVFAVTWWKGLVWVGAGPQGLWCNVSGSWQLELVKASIHATGLDAGERLLITSPTRIADTDDGVNFRTAGDDMLRVRTRGLPVGHFVC